MLWFRPRVEQLQIRLYDRPLPVGSIETVASRTIRRNDYSLTVHLTADGHVLEWSNSKTHLVEMIAVERWPPGDLMTYRFKGEQRGRCKIQTVEYQLSLQVEVVPAEVFLHVNDELRAEGAKRGFLYEFAPHTRLAVVPLSFVTIEPLPSGLSVASFHTFPGELAIIKTQSLIEP